MQKPTPNATYSSASWSQQELDNIRKDLNQLEDYSFFKFVIDVISTAFFGSVVARFLGVPWFLQLVGLNTIIMATSCFSIRSYYQSKLDSVLQSKSLLDCLYADTQLLHTQQENLASYKMRQIATQSKNYHHYLKPISEEIKQIAELDLQQHQKSALMHSFYQQILLIPSYQSYYEYAAESLSLIPPQGLSAEDTAALLSAAILNHDPELVLNILDDLRTKKFPLRKHLSLENDVIYLLEKDTQVKEALEHLFGAGSSLSKLSLIKERALHHHFPLLKQLAYLSYVINVSLLEPVRNIQDNLTNYQQVGFLFFASALFVTIPLGVLVGILGLTFVIGQSLKLSMRFLTQRHSLQELIEAYSQHPVEYYEKVLALKIDQELHAHHPQGHHFNFMLEHLSESQSLNIFEIFLTKVRHKGVFSEHNNSLEMALPFLLKQKTKEMQQLYLHKLRPLSKKQHQALSQEIQSYIIPQINQQIENNHQAFELLVLKEHGLQHRLDALFSQLPHHPAAQQYPDLKQNIEDFYKTYDIHVLDHIPLSKEEHELALAWSINKKLIADCQALTINLHQQQIRAAHLDLSLQGLVVQHDVEAEKKQQIYNKMYRSRGLRDNIMSYVFPINTINQSLIGILLYFIPMAIALTAIIYAVAPAVLLVLSLIAVVATCEYLKRQERAAMQMLSLSDYWGQHVDALHQKLFHEKILSLQQQDPELAKKEVADFVKTVQSAPLSQSDRQLLDKITPDLQLLSERFGKEVQESLLILENYQEQDMSHTQQDLAMQAEHQNDAVLIDPHNPAALLEQQIHSLADSLEHHQGLAAEKISEDIAHLEQALGQLQPKNASIELSFKELQERWYEYLAANVDSSAQRVVGSSLLKIQKNNEEKGLKNDEKRN